METQTKYTPLRCYYGTPYLMVEVVDDDQQVLGEARIYVYTTRTRTYAEIHDVKVSEAYQGNGYGRSVMESCIALLQQHATKHQVEISVRLTSEPQRIAANALYHSLNFRLLAAAVDEAGTNLYGMKITP